MSFSKLSDVSGGKNSVAFEETNVSGKDFYIRLKDKKSGLVLELNLSNYQRECHEINDLLTEKRF